MNKCASCENNGMNVMSFTWFTDQEPDPNFKKVGELAKDNNSVWSCGKCGTTYYQRRGTVNDTMVSLNPAHCDSLLKWGNKTLHLALTHKKTLTEIGGIFQGFMVGIDALTYPCRCKKISRRKLADEKISRQPKKLAEKLAKISRQQKLADSQ
ncbi:hypothetical protein [Candidatus Venteria ishoeyi]|uniref:Uncharacterized protein n=1 Tax=Candidatus Venteria ishoeyi TaxID=1899563 RepID=A0A1H6FGD4_9GAMM|nr:hypothetical protein [Candidatus Venteria ishoeyi]SEH08226.1 Uncharacterised protein [Candidatus Venteria ishoeyi]SEH08631.1 Uncharacterised protein [Candidatus Venteria ishoeyi]